MAALRGHGRALLLIALVAALVVSLFPMPISAITKSQVDSICDDSREQLADYRAARAEFEEAEEKYWDAVLAVEEIVARQERNQGTIDSHTAQLDVVQEKIEEQAVQLYMMGGAQSPVVILSASSVDEYLTSSSFLTAAAQGGQESIDTLVATRNELDRLQIEFGQTQIEREAAEANSLEIRNSMEAAAEAERAAYNKLSKKCADAQNTYEREQAAKAAAARQRASGSVQVGNFICPFTPGRTSFRDTWGAPRSGGRRHKGTDMFAAWNEPTYAVQSGRVSIANYGLGGKVVWLTADTGYAYYYAHLADWNVSNGQRVTQGQTIAFNGDSGNARGGSPHLHFEIHPGGRGRPAVNPYPTLAAACK